MKLKVYTHTVFKEIAIKTTKKQTVYKKKKLQRLQQQIVVATTLREASAKDK